MSLVVLGMVEGQDSGHYAPKFQIVDGVHNGKTYLGHVYLSPLIHQTGDIVDGRYHQGSGVIKSIDMINELSDLGRHFAISGFISAIIGLGWAVIRRFKIK